MYNEAEAHLDLRIPINAHNPLTSPQPTTVSYPLVDQLMLTSSTADDCVRSLAY